jgi:hypothetical protein
MGASWPIAERRLSSERGPEAAIRSALAVRPVSTDAAPGKLETPTPKADADGF